MHARLKARLLRPANTTRTGSLPLTVAGQACADGEAPLKELPERLAECIESTQGPADPAELARWLAQHAKGY